MSFIGVLFNFFKELKMSVKHKSVFFRGYPLSLLIILTYLQNDIKTESDEEGHQQPEGGDEDVVPQSYRGEVRLALQTETEDWEEAHHQAGDDHALVELQVPHGQQGHQEGGEDDTDTISVNQTHCGKTEEDEDLNEKNKL